MDIIDTIENLELLKKIGDYDGIHLNYRSKGFYSTRPSLHASGYYCKCGVSKRRLKKCECELLEMDERSGSKSNNTLYLLKYKPHECLVTKERDGVYKIELTSLYVERDSALKKLLLKESTNIYFVDIFTFEKTTYIVDGETIHNKSYMAFNEHTVEILELIKRKIPSEAVIIEKYFEMIQCIGSLNYGFKHEQRMRIIDDIETYTDKSLMECLESNRTSSKTTKRILEIFDAPSIYEAYEAEPFLVSFCAMVDSFQSKITCKKDLIARVPDSLTELIGFLESFSPKDLNRLSSIHNYSRELDSKDFIHILEIGETTGIGFLNISMFWKSITDCLNKIVQETVFEVDDEDILKAKQEIMCSYKKYLKEVKGYVSFNRDGLTLTFRDWYFFNKKDPIQKIRDFAQHQLSDTLKESLPEQSDKFEIFLDLIDTDVVKALEIISSNKQLTKKQKEEIAKSM